MGKYYNTNPNNHSFLAIIIIKKNTCELLVLSKPKPWNVWSTWHLCSLLLALLSNEGFVDVGNDTWKQTKKTLVGLNGSDECMRHRTIIMHVSVDSPPPAIVALIRESNSSSPRMASCKWRGVIRFTFKSLEALPANSNTWERENEQTGINANRSPPHTQKHHMVWLPAPMSITNAHKMFGGRLTSAVRYSRMAALYTAAVAPTRPWLVVRVFKCLWIRPTGNWQETDINKRGLNTTDGGQTVRVRTTWAARPQALIRGENLPAAQPSGSETRPSPWLCHCLFLLCHQPVGGFWANNRNQEWEVRLANGHKREEVMFEFLEIRRAPEKKTT